MKDFLFAIVARTVPGKDVEHWLGDLEEEAIGKPEFWLLRHALLAAAHGVRIRLTNANFLECAAATAFLIGLPLVLTLELRRFVLTLIPFRESAEFSTPVAVALAIGIGIIAAWETRLLGRRWLPALLATAMTAAIVTLTNSPLIMAAAAFLGGSLAIYRRKRGDTA
ncbi:MAG: hypothetical protein ACKV2U_28055 [Bryobacteraceae bacterium]